MPNPLRIPQFFESPGTTPGGGPSLTRLSCHTGVWGIWVKKPILEHHLEQSAASITPGSNVVIEIGPPAEGALSWANASRSAAADAIHRALEWSKNSNFTLFLRPDSAHVVSDIPSTLALLRSQPALKLALDAEALITASMQPNRAQHLERLVAAFGGHPQLGCVIRSAPPPLGNETTYLGAKWRAPLVWPMSTPNHKQTIEPPNL